MTDKKEKLSPEEKAELRKAAAALRDLIRRARRKGAIVDDNGEEVYPDADVDPYLQTA